MNLDIDTIIEQQNTDDDYALKGLLAMKYNGILEVIALEKEEDI